MNLCRMVLILAVMLLGYSLITAGMLLPWLAIPALLLLVARKRYRTFSAFGTARWADDTDLRRAGMLDPETGMILGRVSVPCPNFLAALIGLFKPRVGNAVACKQFLGSIRRFNRRHEAKAPLVRLNAVHSAVVGPTGAGKGVSFVIPHLMTCTESTVCVDFKGDMASIAVELRRKMGHRVVILDPFKAVSGLDTFNPIAHIDRDSPLALEDCRDLAAALVVRTGQEKEPHWADSAEAFIAAMIAVVVFFGEPDDRSLQTVRTLLTNPAKMEAAINLMCASDAWDGMLARMGNQLTHYKDKELASTLTTINRFLRFLDTPSIYQNTKASTFDPAELLKGKCTVYLVLPPEHMRSQSALLRMWIGSMMRAVLRGGLQEKNKVHFILDEAASLGHLEAIDDAVDKYRGYGIRLQFYYQSLGQLKLCFPEGQDQTLLSNTTQIFFAVNDYQTAEYVSNRLGESTIVVDSGGTGSGQSYQSPDAGAGSRGGSSNQNQNWSQQARKLLKPEEVLALPERTAITFTPGIPPLATTLVRYYERDFKEGSRFWREAEMWLNAIIMLVLSIMVASIVGSVITR